jgi:hypothetical protein
LWKRVRAVELGGDDVEGEADAAPLTDEQKLEKEDGRIMAELRNELPKQNVSYSGNSLNVTLVPMAEAETTER